jgi:hypothetical protein
MKPGLRIVAVREPAASVSFHNGSPMAVADVVSPPLVGEHPDLGSARRAIPAWGGRTDCRIQAVHVAGHPRDPEARVEPISNRGPIFVCPSGTHSHSRIGTSTLSHEQECISVAANRQTNIS